MCRRSLGPRLCAANLGLETGLKMLRARCERKVGMIRDSFSAWSPPGPSAMGSGGTPLERYTGLLSQLARGRSFGIEGSIFRFASLLLAMGDVPDAARQLESAAKSLRETAGWLSRLSHVLRYAVAAMALRRGQPVAETQARLRRIQERFRARRLPRGGTPEILAATMLAGSSEDASDALIDRVHYLLSQWSRAHPFLSGNSDYPLATFLARFSDEDITILCRRVEEIYDELVAAGCGRGARLQITAQALASRRWWAGQAVGRFRAVQWAFEAQGLKVRRGGYDAVGLLALSPAVPEQIAVSIAKSRGGLEDRLRFPLTRTPLVVSAALSATDPSLFDGPRDGGVGPEALLEISEALLAARLSKSPGMR